MKVTAFRHTHYATFLIIPSTKKYCTEAQADAQAAHFAGYPGSERLHLHYADLVDFGSVVRCAEVRMFTSILTHSTPYTHAPCPFLSQLPSLHYWVRPLHA